MQRQPIVDSSNVNKLRMSYNSTSSTSEEYSKRKRHRVKNFEIWTKKEEERILKYALKLSEKEYLTNISSQEASQISKINQIEEVSVFRATEEDFLNPIGFFDRLWEHNANSTGIVKIIPPEKWVERQKESFERDNRSKILTPNKKLESRKQTLNDLYMAKRFEHVKEHNYVEYKKFGEKVFEEIYGEEGKITPSIEQIEEDYWKFCQDDSERKITVQYAADISTQFYFNQSELAKKITETTQISEDNLDKFSLLKVNVNRNSMLQFTKLDETNQISGITVPWFYFGMVYSTFCWHVEDLYLYSLNYLHEGSPKIWYGISHLDKEKMDDYIKKKYYAILIKQPDLVHRLTVHINPLELIKQGIKVYRTVQYPGEIVVTLPKGFHSGFSTGSNIAEAVNFSTIKWLDLGLRAQTDYRKNNQKLPVFSMEWIIMQNYEHFDLSQFDDKKNLKSRMTSLILNEIENRQRTESFFKINNINYIIEEMDKHDNIESFDCDFCTYYGFLSQLMCNNCKRKGCLTHSIQCKCLPTDFTIRYRYLTQNEMTYEDYINSLDFDEKTKIKEIFELFDKNLDGGIDIKELKFILNSLDIFPNHEELTSMMYEADVSKKGYINESDFLYIIAKQKIEYKNKLIKEAKNAFIALGGNENLEGIISTKRIQEVLKGEFELSDELEVKIII